MTLAGPSITEQDAFVALRAFLVAVLPAGVEVIQGQINRVPSPAGGDYVVMFPLFREPLATNLETYVSPDSGPLGGVEYLLSTQVTIQLDVHGPGSADNVQTIQTLWRSDYGVSVVQSQGYDVTPLYTSTPRQAPFHTGEQQWDNRWVVDAVMQVNPVIALPQDFATELELGLGGPDITGLTPGLIDVDVAYPPTAGSVAVVSVRAAVAGKSF